MTLAEKLQPGKERPILFSAQMVRAILEGRKTQTRRLVKPQPVCGEARYEKYCSIHGAMPMPCRYGQPGDLLWVKETWQQVIRRRVTSEEAWWPGKQEWPGVGSRPCWPSQRNPEHHVIIHRADGEMPGDFPERWRPSIHMPRWASRITLEVTGVRVERLQDISRADALAEGIDDYRPGFEWPMLGDPEPGQEEIAAYAYLWGQINGHASWRANAWVWVVEFKAVSP